MSADPLTFNQIALLNNGLTKDSVLSYNFWSCSPFWSDSKILNRIWMRFPIFFGSIYQYGSGSGYRSGPDMAQVPNMDPVPDMDPVPNLSPVPDMDMSLILIQFRF
jgi:hypothetical protein